MGLGCILSGVQEVTDRCSWSPPDRLADCVGQDRLDAGAIYPDQKDLRNVSAHVAAAVIERGAAAAGTRRPNTECDRADGPRGDVVSRVPQLHLILNCQL